MFHLKEGDKAPDFQGFDQNNNPISLNSFSGKRLIIYFYPKDDTPGCTAEACDLRDNESALISKGFAILGVSGDSIKSHARFAEKYKLPFPLLADTDKKMMQDYGVWGPKKFLGRTYDGVHRTTFVVSADAIIEKIITKVDTRNHAAQVLSELGL
jgi:thioredoxin-dependent peroxiredoxin